MPQNQHQCIFYERADELWSLCIPLIQESAGAGFKWLYIADDHDRHEVQAAFADSLQPLPAGEVVYADSLGLLDAPGSVNAIISQLRARVKRALEESFSGLFLLTEMTWSLRTSFGLAYLGEYEGRLHELLSSMPLRAACLYNRRVFPETMILDALRTHPGVRAVDGVHRNPHFLPPAAVLYGDARAHLQQWLKAISPTLTETWYQGSGVFEPAYSAAPSRNPSIAPFKAPIYNLKSDAPLVTPNADQQRWKIHCLGELQVYGQDSTALRWNTVGGATLKAKTLFAYLLHRGQKGATAEEVADLLWPEARSTVQSLNRLYHTVHCLRMALSPGLTSSRDSPFVINDNQRYYLALPEGAWIDIPVFEQLCYKAERLLRENKDEESLLCHVAAERLYRGVLLADIPVQYIENVDEDWCWSRRYWLQEMYLKMLTYMAGTYRRRNDIPRALAYCEKVLDIDPCTERAHQEMMRLFHASGRRDALERQYRLCAGALARYDGRKPSPATQALFQSLLSTL
jgi:two-component SAPR family response regulator